MSDENKISELAGISEAIEKLAEERKKKPQVCLICHKPLPLEWSAWPVHFEDCQSCIYCNEDVPRDQIESILAKHKADGETPESHPEKIVVYHKHCHNAKLEADFKNRPVVITQEHLDMLNTSNLMFKSNLSVSIETNQKEAEIHSSKWISEMSLEEKFITMKRMEAVTAMMSIALSKDKQKIQIKLGEIERLKVRDLQQADERIEIEKDRIKKREREALKLSPEARASKKAIEGLMAIGISREDAEKMMQDQKNQKRPN